MGDIYTIQFYRSFYSLSFRNVLTFWFSAEQEEEESPKIPPVESVSVEKGVESATVSEEKTELSSQVEVESKEEQDDGK